MYQYDCHAPPTLAQRALRICLWLTLALLLAIFIMVVILFAIYIVFFPTPYLPEFTLQSFSQSEFNISTQTLTAAWIASLRVANPNEEAMVDYYRVIAHVIHKDYCLAEARVPPFHQGKQDNRTVDVNFALVNSYVEQPVLNAITGEKAGGEMKFNLKLWAVFDLYYRLFGGGEHNTFLKIWCNNINVSSSSGTMIGEPIDCRAKQYKGTLEGDRVSCSIR